MTGAKNIIIISKVGSGKSALANVLSNSDEFKEENSSLTKVWRAVDKEFEENEIKYRVIDTVGLGDAKLPKEQLLEKFAEEIGSYIDEGISQVFLVIGGKLDKEVLTEFMWLNEHLFDSKIFDYTTIVRTNFPNFRNQESRENDTKELINFFNDNSKENYTEVNEKVLKKEKIIHVDNPLSNEKFRQKSRKKLLDYLKKFSDGEIYKSNLSKWLVEKYPESERGNKSVLDISNQKLKGRLSLKGFTNLKRLNCSDNQLTSLDLSDCKKLVELNCSHNKFTNLNFLKSVSLDNLEQLNISNCPLKGDLQPLKNLTKLEILFITNTNLDGDLEWISSSCKKLVCNSNPSTKIMEMLDKNGCSEEDLYHKKYYNLDHWRATDKQNKLTADVIPSERLFVIRSNLKQFLKKWGSSDKNGSSELSKLQNPQELNTYWYLGEGGQWLARGTAVTGGVLAATVNPILGGVLAAVSPVVEISASQMKEKLYEVRQNKWDQFLTDADNFLDNFNELLGTLKRISGGELGEVNLKLKELKKKVDNFLQDYDKDSNQEIDLDELINERIKFNQELSKIEEIEQAIKALEKQVIKCKKGTISEEEDEEIEQKPEQLSPLEIKLAQRKKEREQLEQKRNELAIQLKEAEVNYQQIKKDLSRWQNDLLLLTDNDEELEALKQEIANLKKELLTAEQKKHDTNQKLIKTNIVLFSHQIKNLNLGSRISQSWTSTCQGAKDCILRTKLYLTTPIYCWDEICEGKLSREMIITEDTNQKGKGKEAENQTKEQYENQIEIAPYQKIN